MVEFRRNLKVIASPNVCVRGENLAVKFNSSGSRILESAEELDELKKVPNDVMEFKLADGTVVNPAVKEPEPKPKATSKKKKENNK